MMLSTPEMLTAGAERGSSLDQRMALRAVGQRGLVVPPVGPGPLVEPDGSEVPVVTLKLQPLQAAPMPSYSKVGAAAGSTEPVEQKALVAVAVAVGQDGTVRAGTVCQPRVDVKAFTGKGEARALRLATKAVDDIHDRMRGMAQETVKLGKNVLYLAVHARSLTNQHSLRWRGYVVVDGKGVHKHLTWGDAEQRIQQYPYEVQAQLQVWDREARELNKAEQAARAQLKRLACG